MKADSDGMNQHKDMAMGKAIEGQGAGAGDFGVKPSGDPMRRVQHMDDHQTGSTADSAHLADHERGARHPISTGANRHPAQAQPDHGPHHMGDRPAAMKRESKGTHHRGQHRSQGR